MHSRKKKTNKQFKQEVFDIVGEEYIFIEDYINTGTKIRVLHRNCGNYYEVTPNKFLQGRRCPHCKGKRISKMFAKTQERFEKEVKETGDGEYTVIGEYVNAHTRVDIKHNICGKTSSFLPQSFLEGHKCQECYYTYKKSHNYFLREVLDMVGEEYTVLSEYVNGREKVMLRHEKCKNVYEVEPNAFLSGRRCPPCSNKEGARKISKTPEVFKKDFYEKFGDMYTLIDTFVSYDMYMKIRHNKCDYEWEVIMNSFYYEKRSLEDSCPKCRVSRGELRVSKWLDENSIKYTTQHVIEECRDIRLLRFDFYLPETCHNKKCIIEYDGEHHFMPISYSRDAEVNIENYLDVTRKDEIKNSFCRDNDILMIRIPYWDFDNIEDILSRFLKCF